MASAKTQAPIVATEAATSDIPAVPTIENNVDKARTYLAETNFLAWPKLSKAEILAEASAFRVAFATVAAAEEANKVKRDDDPNYVKALDALNARYPMLVKYREELKALNLQYSNGLADDLALAKSQYNTLSVMLKSPAWGNVELPTITNTGEIRKPKGSGKSKAKATK